MGPQPTPPSGSRATVMPDGTTCVPIMNEVPRPAAPAAPGPTTAGPPSAGSEPRPAHEPQAGDKPNPAVEAFNRIKCDLGELKEYGSYFLAAKADGFKQSIRNVGLYAAVGVLGLIVGG